MHSQVFGGSAAIEPLVDQRGGSVAEPRGQQVGQPRERVVVKVEHEATHHSTPSSSSAAFASSSTVACT